MRILTITAIALTLAACASPKQVEPDDPFYAPVIPEMPNESKASNGSLFQDMQARDIYSDSKARQVGDIIVVSLNENTSANKGAKSEISKDTEVGMQAPNVLGKIPSWGGVPMAVDLGSNSDFSGESKVRQSNTLDGTISVTVTQILPNGNLVVRGEKWITINTGDEYVRLTGIIRADDIAADNTIDSNRVANARIQYSGTGSAHDNQEAGWLARFFTSALWPL
ncbi:MAG: flagellar basal body L-ring protein FlgH [Gammaproteobacteria bacterium]|nr:flagellar basal body L-ring protein FlgH [Gammaproteobacteria bacterium]